MFLESTHFSLSTALLHSSQLPFFGPWTSAGNINSFILHSMPSGQRDLLKNNFYNFTAWTNPIQNLRISHCTWHKTQRDFVWASSVNPSYFIWYSTHFPSATVACFLVLYSPGSILSYGFFSLDFHPSQKALPKTGCLLSLWSQKLPLLKGRSSSAPNLVSLCPSSWSRTIFLHCTPFLRVLISIWSHLSCLSITRIWTLGEQGLYFVPH